MTAQSSSKASAAGADIVVTGTIVEQVQDVETTLRAIIKGVKENGG